MTLSANTVWEVRPTANDLNGGAFVAGASGTDYSQQDAAQLALTDLACTNNTTLTSAAGGFTAAMIGNLIQITAGTNFTAGFYQITAFTNGNTVTLDRNPTTGVNASAGTGAIGGALATLAKLAGAMVSSNKGFAKAGAGYTTTATIAFGAAGVTPATNAPYTRLIGYGTVRGDGGRPTLTLQTNSTITGLSFTNSGWSIENFNVDCGGLAGSIGIATSTFTKIRNCKVVNFKNVAFNLSVDCLIADSEAANGGAGAFAAVYCPGTNPHVLRCNVHDNPCPGVFIGNGVTGAVVDSCLITNNTGASSDGIAGNNGPYNRGVFVNNTIYGNGRHGIDNNTATVLNVVVRNNILAKNGASGTGYGLSNSGGAGAPADPNYDGNAYWSNASGTRNNLDDTTVNPVNGVAPYTNTLDVILTADPFTNAAAGDFTLNTVAGGGAACRGAGTPGPLPGIGQVGHIDLGALQHADPAAPSAPSTPTLAIADHADGTGATATVSGGSADAMHNVYAASLLDPLGPVAQTLWGSIVGNGTVNLPLTRGYYVGTVQAVRSVNVVMGTELTFVVTDAATPAVEYRAMQAIQARLQGLALSGIPNGSFAIRWLPRTQEQIVNVPVDTLPMVVIACPLAELMLGGLNNTDDIGFPVIVAFIDKDPDLSTDIPRKLLWRERSIRALDQQRLAGVPEVQKVEVLPEAVVDLAAWKGRYWTSAFVARVVTRLGLG